jgi:pantothenate kinase
MFYIDVSETQTGNQEWTIKRHWQYWAHKTQDEDKQSKKYLKTKPQNIYNKNKNKQKGKQLLLLIRDPPCYS